MFQFLEWLLGGMKKTIGEAVDWVNDWTSYKNPSSATTTNPIPPHYPYKRQRDKDDDDDNKDTPLPDQNQTPSESPQPTSCIGINDSNRHDTWHNHH